MIQNEYKYVSVLLTSTLLVELMDELSRTEYYRHLLKMRGNAFVKELEKTIDEDLPVICGKADMEMLSVMREQQKMMEIISNMNPNHYIVLNAILEKYRHSPEVVCDALNINVIQAE